jgi:transposase-like protein
MEKSNRAKRFSTEVRARAVRMIFEHEHEYANQSAAIMAIAPKIGCFRDTLRRWVKQSDIDNGRKDGQTCDERAHIKAMEREIRELRQANEILRKASAYFAPTLTHASMCCRAAGRSSPAPSNDDRFHRRAPQWPGCRAGLLGFANRPVHCPAGDACIAER